MVATATKVKAKAKPQRSVAVAAAAELTTNDRLQAEFELIAAKNGGVLPADAVVAWARANPKSELHKRFTWNNGEAAEKWRIQEARILIARITIEPRPETTVRAWVNLPSDRVGERPAYRPTVRVMSDAEQRAELLQMVKDELGQLRRKYADLTELASVWSAIDKSGAA